MIFRHKFTLLSPFLPLQDSIPKINKNLGRGNGESVKSIVVFRFHAKWKPLIIKCHILLNRFVHTLSFHDVEIGKVILCTNHCQFALSPFSKKMKRKKKNLGSKREREKEKGGEKVVKQLLTGTLKNM